MQQVFLAIDNVEFVKNIGDLENQKDILTNIRLIKTSLYLYAKRKLTIQDIIKLVRSCTLYENESGLHGIPLKVSKIQKVLRNAGKFVPEKLIKL